MLFIILESVLGAVLIMLIAYFCSLILESVRGTAMGTAEERKVLHQALTLGFVYALLHILVESLVNIAAL